MRNTFATDALDARRDRLRRQLARHVTAALGRVAAGDRSVAETAAHLTWLADLYAAHVSALERHVDPM